MVVPENQGEILTQSPTQTPEPKLALPSSTDTGSSLNAAVAAGGLSTAAGPANISVPICTSGISSSETSMIANPATSANNIAAGAAVIPAAAQGNGFSRFLGQGVKMMSVPEDRVDRVEAGADVDTEITPADLRRSQQLACTAKERVSTNTRKLPGDMVGRTHFLCMELCRLIEQFKVEKSIHEELVKTEKRLEATQEELEETRSQLTKLRLQEAANAQAQQTHQPHGLSRSIRRRGSLAPQTMLVGLHAASESNLNGPGQALQAGRSFRRRGSLAAPMHEAPSSSRLVHRRGSLAPFAGLK